MLDLIYAFAISLLSILLAYFLVYRAKYRISIRCPNCGSRNVKILSIKSNLGETSFTCYCMCKVCKHNFKEEIKE
jgi:transcription elongation factor Elf1